MWRNETINSRRCRTERRHVFWAFVFFHEYDFFHYKHRVLIVCFDFVFFSLLLFKHETSAKQRNNTIHRSIRRQYSSQPKCIQEEMRCEWRIFNNSVGTTSIECNTIWSEKFQNANSSAFHGNTCSSSSSRIFPKFDLCNEWPPKSYDVLAGTSHRLCATYEMINNNNFNKKPNWDEGRKRNVIILNARQRCLRFHISNTTWDVRHVRLPI